VDKVKLEILGLSASSSQTGSFALVLGEEGGKRRLPIIIGMFEAQAIAIEMEKITSHRPMTHDLFKSFADSFKYEVYEILISDLREGVFYAKICCGFRDGSNYVEIDARPSDAIAIGIRFDVPVYALESVLKEAGVILTSDDEDEKTKESITNKPSSSRKPPRKQVSFEASLQDLDEAQLQKELENALAQEDYERAAKIRDEMSKR
jgi:bifunctional DNase/RNase